MLLSGTSAGGHSRGSGRHGAQPRWRPAWGSQAGSRLDGSASDGRSCIGSIGGRAARPCCPNVGPLTNYRHGRADLFRLDYHLVASRP